MALNLFGWDTGKSAASFKKSQAKGEKGKFDAKSFLFGNPATVNPMLALLNKAKPKKEGEKTKPMMRVAQFLLGDPTAVFRK